MSRAVEYCENHILSKMTTYNFNDFSATAELYSMSRLLQQIDVFVANNLLRIARDGSLYMVTYEQLLHCLCSDSLSVREIDLFQVLMLLQLIL